MSKSVLVQKEKSPVEGKTRERLIRAMQRIKDLQTDKEFKKFIHAFHKFHTT